MYWNVIDTTVLIPNHTKHMHVHGLCSVVMKEYTDFQSLLNVVQLVSLSQYSGEMDLAVVFAVC